MENMYNKKKLPVYNRKVGCLINESAFVVLNDVTWPIRNILQHPRSVSLWRKILNHVFVFDEVQILYVRLFVFFFFFFFFQTYMPRKIPKHEYKPQGTVICYQVFLSHTNNCLLDANAW